MEELFRLKRSLPPQGWFISVFASAMIAVGLWTLFGIKPGEHGYPNWRSIYIGGGAMLAMGSVILFGGLWILLASRREAIILSGSRFVNRGLFGERSFDLSEVEHLKWRNWPAGGSIAVRVAGRKIGIEISTYETTARLRIIEYFYRGIPADRQENWPAFCHRIALPLRDGVSPMKRRLEVRGSLTPRSTVLITRRRYDTAGVVCTAITAIVSIILWQQFNIPQAFSLLPFVVIFWLVLRYSIPATGREELTLRSYGFTLPMLYIGALGIGGTILAAVLKLPQFVSWLCFLAIFAGMMIFAYKLDRNDRQTDRLAGEIANEMWQRGEPVEEISG